MSDFSEVSRITNQDIQQGVFWKPQQPRANIFQRPEQPAAAQQPPAMSVGLERAAEFVAALRKEGPRAAYAKYGSGDINKLFDAAVGYGLLDAGERESMWAQFSNPQATAPEPSTTNTTLSAEMIWRSGGYRNALDAQWRMGNYIKPDRSQYDDPAKFRKDYEEWLKFH